jgi:hypothetical protein
MTIPIRPAPLDSAPLDLLSRCIFHARFGDCALLPLTGQVPTFTRAATASVVDSLGTAFTVGHSVPAFEPRDWLRTGVRTHHGLLLGTSDRLTYPAEFRPRVSSGWLAFMQLAAIPAANVALFSVTTDAATGARLVLDSSGTFWRFTHHNGSAGVTATLSTAPAAGDSVLLYWTLYSDGSVQLWQSINFGVATATARTAAPASGALATTWGTGAKIRLGASGTGNYGTLWVQSAKLVRGLPTYAQLARAF